MSSSSDLKIAPSILSADFARLGEQVAEAEKGGADYIHIDVMDGCFVPNLTIGPTVIKSLRPWTKLPFDVHLMIVDPERFIADFVAAGANIVTVHSEACDNLSEVLGQIRKLGARAGFALNPDTTVDSIRDALPYADFVLVMTVHPGFPAQSFIESVVPKISQIRQLLDTIDSKAELAVDGGINQNTAAKVANAGARVLVAGSAVYDAVEGIRTAIEQIRESAKAEPR